MTAPTPVSVLLDRLEEARAAATPGPWAQHPSDGCYVIGDVREGDDGLEYLDVADAGGRSPGYPTSGDADAACIVAAVNAVPRLTAALRAVLAVLDDAEARCERNSFRFHDGTKPAPAVQVDDVRTVLASALAEEEGR